MPSDRKAPKTVEQLGELARDVVARGGGVAVLTDFDGTVSETAGDGSDPFATSFDARAGHALARIQAHGQVVGILSNRAGGQITARSARVGFAHAPYVVGTYGYELLSPAGESRIDDLFLTYREVITRQLGVARRALVRLSGANDDVPPTIEATIETGQGPIYVEIKGACVEYPEGLAQEYNFNRITPDARTWITEELEHAIRLAMAREDASQMRGLSLLWGGERIGEPAAPGRYSWALKPMLARGKAYGLVRMLRTIRARSDQPGDRCLLIYMGGSPGAGWPCDVGRQSARAPLARTGTLRRHLGIPWLGHCGVAG